MRGLYAITPPGLSRSTLLSRVQAALRGGAVWVQYRDKESDADERMQTARALCVLCREFGAQLLINDDLPLAIAVGADGVHLGITDGDLTEARRLLGRGRLLGASCYADFERARLAVSAGVDYVALGAVFPSPTKPRAAQAPLSLFARCRRELGVPICAIGGITVANAAQVLAAGADLLAVISDLFEAPDVEGRAAAYQQLFKENPGEFTESATV